MTPADDGWGSLLVVILIGAVAYGMEWWDRFHGTDRW